MAPQSAYQLPPPVAMPSFQKQMPQSCSCKIGPAGFSGLPGTDGNPGQDGKSGKDGSPGIDALANEGLIVRNYCFGKFFFTNFLVKIFFRLSSRSCRTFRFSRTTWKFRTTWTARFSWLGKCVFFLNKYTKTAKKKFFC